MKFTTISKISNTSQMLIIPSLSMHYIGYSVKRNKNIPNQRSYTIILKKCYLFN